MSQDSTKQQHTPGPWTADKLGGIEARLRKALNSIAFGEINATSADDAIDQVRDYARRTLAADAPNTDEKGTTG